MMKDHRMDAAFPVLALSVWLVLGAFNPGTTAAHCSAKVAGTYLTTITTQGTFASRSTLMFGTGGTLSWWTRPKG